jgi:hypothetical protein
MGGQITSAAHWELVVWTSPLGTLVSRERTGSLIADYYSVVPGHETNFALKAARKFQLYLLYLCEGGT